MEITGAREVGVALYREFNEGSVENDGQCVERCSKSEEDVGGLKKREGDNIPSDDRTVQRLR